MFSYFFPDNEKNNDEKNNHEKNNDNSDNNDNNDNSDKIKFLNDIDNDINEVIIDVDENNLLLIDEEVISYGDLNNSDDNIINMTPVEKENCESIEDDNNDVCKDEKTSDIPRPTLVIPDTNNVSFVGDITVEPDSGSDSELDIFVGGAGAAGSAVGASAGGTIFSSNSEKKKSVKHHNNAETEKCFLIDRKYSCFIKNKTLFVGAFCCGATVFFYFAVNGFNA